VMTSCSAEGPGLKPLPVLDPVMDAVVTVLVAGLITLIPP
jgi:hypothetical protein